MRGRVVADFAVGEVHPSTAMTTETMNLWMSSGKPLTAALILKLEQDGRLSLDDRVARFLPEFEAGGKAGVTFRHVLTHTGGFPNVEIDWPESPWERIVEKICQAPIEPD